MRISLVTSACCILLAMVTAAQGQPAEEDVFTTRFRQLTIPFRLPESVTLPVSVQLHVSTDRGATWRLVESIDRPSGEFQFRADGDGSYWFCSLTLFSDGRKLPARFTPERKVRVDSVHPTIQIKPRVGPGGRITIECRANDHRFARDGLKLEYITGEDDNWQPLPLEGPVDLVAPGSLLCRASWQPTTPARLVVIKATARDKAGNITVTHQRVFLPPLSLRRPPRNPSSAPAPKGSVPWPADNAPVAPPAETPAVPATPDPGSTTQPPTEPGQAVQDPAIVPLPRIDTRRTPPQQEADPVVSSTRPLPDLIPDPARPAAVREKPAVHVTSSRRFHLEYEVQQNVAIQEVQLWGTLDRGKSWQKWGLDTDQTSPLHIATRENGLYGFRIVIVDGSGRFENMPTPGADADVWIRVDSQEDGP
jgi:hypothetical protein